MKNLTKKIFLLNFTKTRFFTFELLRIALTQYYRLNTANKQLDCWLYVIHNK